MRHAEQSFGVRASRGAIPLRDGRETLITVRARNSRVCPRDPTDQLSDWQLSERRAGDFTLPFDIERQSHDSVFVCAQLEVKSHVVSTKRYSEYPAEPIGQYEPLRHVHPLSVIRPCRHLEVHDSILARPPSWIHTTSLGGLDIATSLLIKYL